LLALALSVLLACFFPAGQDDGFYRELHPDGSLHLEVEVKPGKDGAPLWDGRCRELAPDGAVLSEGRFKDGRAQGKWTFRHANGKTRARGVFEDGRGEREWQLRRDTGQLWAEGTLAGGELSGTWTFYDEDEKVDPLHSGVYSPGEDRWPSGLLRARGALLDGAPHGPWEGWWEDGSLREAGFFARGERVGPWRFSTATGRRTTGCSGRARRLPRGPRCPFRPLPRTSPPRQRRARPPRERCRSWSGRRRRISSGWCSACARRTPTRARRGARR
jgi:antitoxin component YwqK of YwqJK toxin-antitoxin module